MSSLHHNNNSSLHYNIMQNIILTKKLLLDKHKIKIRIQFLQIEYFTEYELLQINNLKFNSQILILKFK
jgi:hypothetical protein